MQLGAAISAVGAIGLTIFAAITLRHARTGGQTADAHAAHAAAVAEREVIPAT